MSKHIWDRGTECNSPRTSPRIGKDDRKNESEILRLRAQVGRLTLACQSMWELLRDRTELDDDILARKIAEVDIRDGSPDGRLGATVIKCPGCGRNTNSRRSVCVWCGVPVDRKHIFEG